MLVELKKQNHVATLTFNAPEQLNAMTVEMGQEFTQHLDNLKTDSHIRVVILTGAGRAFSAGGNLDMLLEKLQKSKSENAAALKSFYQTFLEIRNLPQPVIAAINGHAVGAGFCITLACDLRYASSDAKMGANFARIGLAPGMGGNYFVTRLVGPTIASEILLTGQIFKAQKMKEFGLLNDVLESDQLLEHVHKVAREIANNGPLAVQQIKQGIQQAQYKSLEDMFEYDSLAQAQCFETNDLKRGIEAVKAKRPPQFEGN